MFIQRHWMTFSMVFTRITIMGKVRNMNHTATIKDFLTSPAKLLCLLIPAMVPSPYTFWVVDRPRMPSGRKIKINTSSTKAKTSS